MTRLVASVFAASTDEILRALHRQVAGADVVELRVDGVSDLDLPRLLAASTVPVILTCRAARQGGAFTGSEAERWAILGRALELGFDYVDVEIDSASPELLARRSARTRLLLSHHDFEAIPSDLEARVARGVTLGADLVKIAARVASIADAVRLGEAGAPARECGRGYVPVALGPSGIAARILSSRLGRLGPLGADLVYATARGLPATGPGQIGLDVLLERYRFRSIGPETRIYGILGAPVSGSLSPAMHNRVFESFHLDAVYVPFEEPDLARFVPEARRLGVAGLSVTRPHKQAILPFLDELDEGARRVGAVNTILARNGRWIGFNTDGAGVVEPLAKRTVLSGRSAVILGAGGAARAAAFALRDAGVEVAVLSRRKDAADAVARAVGGVAEELGRVLRLPYDILVNATPVGSSEVSPLDEAALRKGAFVLDMVYDPEETALLRAARQAGAVPISGLEMLLAQASKQAEIWTGRKPPDDLLWAALRE